MSHTLRRVIDWVSGMHGFRVVDDPATKATCGVLRRPGSCSGNRQLHRRRQTAVHGRGIRHQSGASEGSGEIRACHSAQAGAVRDVTRNQGDAASSQGKRTPSDWVTPFQSQTSRTTKPSPASKRFLVNFFYPGIFMLQPAPAPHRTPPSHRAFFSFSLQGERAWGARVGPSIMSLAGER